MSLTFKFADADDVSVVSLYKGCAVECHVGVGVECKVS